MSNSLCFISLVRIDRVLKVLQGLRRSAKGQGVVTLALKGTQEELQVEPEPYEANYKQAFAVDDLLYITSGPSKGRALRVKATGGDAIELEGGHLLGNWPLGARKGNWTSHFALIPSLSFKFYVF